MHGTVTRYGPRNQLCQREEFLTNLFILSKNLFYSLLSWYLLAKLRFVGTKVGTPCTTSTYLSSGQSTAPLNGSLITSDYRFTSLRSTYFSATTRDTRTVVHRSIPRYARSRVKSVECKSLRAVDAWMGKLMDIRENMDWKSQSRHIISCTRSRRFHEIADPPAKGKSTHSYTLSRYFVIFLELPRGEGRVSWNARAGSGSNDRKESRKRKQRKGMRGERRGVERMSEGLEAGNT